MNQVDTLNPKQSGLLMKFLEAEKLVEKHQVDCWLVTTAAIRDPNSNILMSLRIHGRHFIIITPPEQTNYVLTGATERPMAEKHLKDVAEIDGYRDNDEMEEKFLKILSNKQNIALNYNDESLRGVHGLTYSDYLWLSKLLPNTNFHSAAKFIYELRSVKNEEEIKNHRAAAKATMAGLELIPDIVKPNMTELEIAAELEYHLRREADGGMAFDTIVGSAENSADPHHNTGNKKIQTGAPLLIDVGIRKGSSVSDLTWTYFVGKPSEEFLAVYQAVSEAKEVGIKALKAKISCKNVACEVIEYFRKTGYDPDELFTHGLGHPIGFECHDIGPGLSKNSPDDMVTLENAVITVEPGLYWKEKWGVRLEDNVVIRKTQAERLCSTPKEPLTI